MNYKVKLADGTGKIIQITSAYFKSWHVWNIRFDDGKAVVLYKLGNEWLQRNEDFLDAHVLKAIGNCIDRIILRRKMLAI